MNKKFILGILLVGLVVIIARFFVLNRTNVPTQIPTTNNPPTTQSTNEEYNVYSTLINSRYVSDQAKLIVIKENTAKSTTPGEDELNETYIKQKIPELHQETINNFKEVNQQSYSLKKQFNLQVNYILISQDEMNNIFEKGKGWDDFYKKYPNSHGTLTLSRVGFNDQKDQALVYIGHMAHWLSGTGYVFLLVKENNVWKIKREVMTWVS